MEHLISPGETICHLWSERIVFLRAIQSDGNHRSRSWSSWRIVGDFDVSEFQCLVRGWNIDG